MPSARAAGPGRLEEHRISFRTVGDAMIVVPVEINGSGPYNFFVDTGTSRTIVEQKLAEELSLQAVPKTNMKLTGVSGTSTVSLVRVDSLGVAGETVRYLYPSVRKSFPEGVRGILGEDFLSKFDVLIDYRRHSLELSADPSGLATLVNGEHFAVSSHGVYSGAPTANRLVMQGHANEFGDTKLSFLLDSGTNAFVLFPSAANGLESASVKGDPMTRAQQTAGGLTFTRKKVHFLFLGGKILPDVSAVLVNGHDPVDVDGVIPTAWFGSLFLCHTGGYVIFNPSVRNAPGPEPERQVAAATAGLLEGK